MKMIEDIIIKNLKNANKKSLPKGKPHILDVDFVIDCSIDNKNSIHTPNQKSNLFYLLYLPLCIT